MLIALSDAALLHTLGYVLGFLTIASAFSSWQIKIRNKGKAYSTLHDQICAWWILTPILWTTLMFFPFSLYALLGLIAWLTLRELQAYWQTQSARMPVSLAFVITMLGLTFLLHFQNISDSVQQDIRWLFYLFLITAANDVAQFIFGKLLGKNLIAPKLSPNKTWEGLWGGVMLSCALSVAIGLALTSLTWPLLAVLGGVLALTGFAGDLFYSSIKRRMSIKDFSNLIPGHGGILDRVDSLVFTTPSLYFFLTSVHPYL